MLPPGIKGLKAPMIPLTHLTPMCLLLIVLFICGALRDLVPFVQFKKREKHPRRSGYA